MIELSRVSMRYTQGDPLPLLIRFPYSDVTKKNDIDQIISSLDLTVYGFPVLIFTEKQAHQLKSRTTSLFSASRLRYGSLKIVFEWAQALC